MHWHWGTFITRCITDTSSATMAISKFPGTSYSARFMMAPRRRTRGFSSGGKSFGNRLSVRDVRGMSVRFRTETKVGSPCEKRKSRIRSIRIRLRFSGHSWGARMSFVSQVHQNEPQGYEGKASKGGCLPSHANKIRVAPCIINLLCDMAAMQLAHSC